MSVHLTPAQLRALGYDVPGSPKRPKAKKGDGSCTFCKTVHKGSPLECRFQYEWKRAAAYAGELPAYEQEYIFARPRLWRFDFAWPDVQVAVELDGGTWTNGRHNRGQGFTDDCIKLNQAAADGWVVLRYTSDMIADNPMGAIEQIVEVIRQRRERGA